MFVVVQTKRSFNNSNTVKPVLRGHLWNKEKWPYKTGDLLKEVKFIWNFYGRTRKRWLFNTGDCWIEMATWTVLTVLGQFNGLSSLTLKSFHLRKVTAKSICDLQILYNLQTGLSLLTCIMVEGNSTHRPIRHTSTCMFFIIVHRIRQFADIPIMIPLLSDHSHQRLPLLSGQI